VPGVFAALQPTRLRFFDSNSVVLINADDVMIVDAQSSADQVRALIEEVAKRTDKPVRTLINTHWHADHTQGNAIWKEAVGAPLEIIGHSSQGEDIEQRAKGQLLKDADELQAALRNAEEELSDGRGLQGEKLDEDGRMALRARLDRNYAYLETQRQTQWELPNRTFEDQLELQRGARTIQLRHYRGHTRGDVVLYLPKEKVLITGDLVDDLPYCGHGYPQEWLATLRELEGLDFEYMIPGHGQVRQGKDHLRLIIRLVESILEQVNAAVAEGADLDSTKQRVDLSEFHDTLVTDDVAQRNFDRFMPETIERAWLEARGELPD
jgi:glyoxylase-like metal-dependent hydrolase (beta-lactamase superfamily II)